MTLIGGDPKYKEDFSTLILSSAHYFNSLFGEGIDRALQNLFVSGNNLFGYKHSLFATYSNKIASTILCYSCTSKRKENLKTGWLLFKYLKGDFFKEPSALIQLNKTVGMLKRDDFYVSNVATYKEYRGRGLAAALLSETEKLARSETMARMVLDVESDNNNAIGLYAYMGYRKRSEGDIKSQNINLKFIRMEKFLK